MSIQRCCKRHPNTIFVICICIRCRIVCSTPINITIHAYYCTYLESVFFTLKLYAFVRSFIRLLLRTWSSYIFFRSSFPFHVVWFSSRKDWLSAGAIIITQSFSTTTIKWKEAMSFLFFGVSITHSVLVHAFGLISIRGLGVIVVVVFVDVAHPLLYTVPVEYCWLFISIVDRCFPLSLLILFHVALCASFFVVHLLCSLSLFYCIIISRPSTVPYIKRLHVLLFIHIYIDRYMLMHRIIV